MKVLKKQFTCKSVACCGKIPRQRQRGEEIFAIVDHLNLGIELVSDESERTEIAKLNLIAGQKAKAATAHAAATEYLQAGLGLLARR